MTELPRHWKPLVICPKDKFAPVHPDLVTTTMAHYQIDEAAARKMLEDEHERVTYFVNDLYQVMVEPSGQGLLHLNIRRRDGGMFKDWRHFQQIKNEIAGPECEAVELYPAESRKVDTTNKWHLWVFPPGVKLEFGWKDRDVSYDENRHVPGMRQRPL